MWEEMSYFTYSSMFISLSKYSMPTGSPSPICRISYVCIPSFSKVTSYENSAHSLIYRCINMRFVRWEQMTKQLHHSPATNKLLGKGKPREWVHGPLLSIAFQITPCVSFTAIFRYALLYLWESCPLHQIPILSWHSVGLNVSIHILA